MVNILDYEGGSFTPATLARPEEEKKTPSLFEYEGGIAHPTGGPGLMEPLDRPQIKPLKPELGVTDKIFKTLGPWLFKRVMPMAEKAGIIEEGTWPLVKEPPARVEHIIDEPAFMSPEGESPLHRTKLIPPPSERGFELAGLSGIQHLDENIKRLLSGTPEEREYAVRSLIEDAMWWAPFLGPEGGAFMHALRGFGKASVYPPRKLFQLYMKFLPPGSKAQQVMQAAVRPYWELFTLPTKVRIIPNLRERDIPLKSLQEVFQPAVERLAPGIAETFRGAQVNREHLQRFGQELSERISTSGLNFRERRDVLEALQRWSPGQDLSLHAKTGRGRQVLAEFGPKFDEWGIGYQSSYKNYFDKALKTQFQKYMVSNPNVSPHMEELVHRVTTELEGTRDAKKIRKYFHDAFESNVFAPDEKVFLHDYYALEANTVQAVNDAARTSSWKLMLSDLKNSGVVKVDRADFEPGVEYIESEAHGLKGSWVPRDVELELRARQQIPQIATGIVGRIISTPMNIWKTMKVVMRPATWFRNCISNVILNDWGGLPFWRLDEYYKSLREMYRAFKHGERIPLLRTYFRLTGFSGGFATSDIEAIEATMKYHLSKGQKSVVKSNMLEAGLTMFDRIASPFRSFYNMQEQWAKYTKFKWNLKHFGMNAEEAAMDAMKWTFNYGEVTRATAYYRRMAAPFITFQSKVLPLMAETAVKHPVRFGKWPLFFSAMQNHSLQELGMSDQEWDAFHRVLPDYIRDGQFLMMPTRDQKGRLQLLNLSYMIPGFGDLNDLGTSPVAWALGNPAITMAAGLYDNRKFSGAPIWYDWQSGPVKAAKAFQFVWDQIVTNELSTGFWDQIFDAYEGHPDALTWQQIAKAELGFKITPINRARAARQFKAIQDIHRAEEGSWLRKELREARSPEEKRKILREHIGNIRRIRR